MARTTTDSENALEQLSAGRADGRPDYLERNQRAWDGWARNHAPSGRSAWSSTELCWGMWDIPESELRLTDAMPPASDVVELGCGTAAISAWLARAGMRPVGIDFSSAQLTIAEGLQKEFGPSFPLIRSNAEETPYDDESFDWAVSEYGASLWCDPRRWLSEARRILRPQGRLVFVTNSPLLMACTPRDGGDLPSDRLVQDSFTSARVEFGNDDSVEFHLSHSQWIGLLRATGFVVESLVEVRPPHGAKPRFDLVSVEWARRWPSDDIWVARKLA